MLKFFKNEFLLSISEYASVSTEKSVIIIGGKADGARQSFIVEYNDENWAVIGNLKQARYRHNAITIGSLIMIIGGAVTNSL